MRASRYSHSEFVYGAQHGGEFRLRGYSTACCREVVKGLIEKDPVRVNKYAFRAARESDLMLTLLYDTRDLIRRLARQTGSHDVTREALLHVNHMRKALKAVETLIDEEWAPPRTYDDRDAKEYPDETSDVWWT